MPKARFYPLNICCGRFPEKWRNIKGTSYTISNHGRIRNKHNRVLRPFTSCWGYKLQYLSSVGRSLSVHRLVLGAFIGESTLVVNHKDGVKTNNHFDNLEYVTYQQNSFHAIRTGLQKIHYIPRKLSAKKVMKIIKYINEGRKQKNIAKIFKVSPQCICDIKKGRHWNHITNILSHEKKI